MENLWISGNNVLWQSNDMKPIWLPKNLMTCSLKFSSLSAPTKIEELTVGSDEKTQRSRGWKRREFDKEWSRQERVYDWHVVYLTDKDDCRPKAFSSTPAASCVLQNTRVGEEGICWKVCTVHLQSQVLQPQLDPDNTGNRTRHCRYSNMGNTIKIPDRVIWHLSALGKLLIFAFGGQARFSSQFGAS